MLKVIMIAFGFLLAFWEHAASGNSPDPVPQFILPNSVEVMEYDGRTLRDPRLNEQPPFAGYPDDLLSGGLNASGFQRTTPPAFADPRHPTATELRRHALYTNYRALIDITTEGGFGHFWGPNLAPDFGPEIDHGLIPGVEYTALMKIPAHSGNINSVPVAVQVPDHFDLDHPCIFLVPPSGSRGYYGGIAVAEWGLLKGCAVVMPGKGTGTGFYYLDSDTGYSAKGILTSMSTAAEPVHFAVEKRPELDQYRTSHPHRVAVKHAHSQINCERLWGDLALQGIEFAFWAINDWFGQFITLTDDHGQPPSEGKRIYTPLKDKFSPPNTLVIAAGTSNGGGAALRALEKDQKKWIDGLVATQPSINPDSAGKLTIQVGSERFSGHGTSLFDNITLMAIYAPCAALSASLQNTPCNLDPIGAPEGARANRCQALFDVGMLKSETPSQQADEALAMLKAHGYTQAQQTLLPGHEWLNLWRALNPTYAAALGRFAVWETIGDISFAATDENSGKPAALDHQVAAALFAIGSGIPPTSGINLINDAAVNGPVLENRSLSPGTNLEDLNLDSALYFRYLASGNPDLLPHEPTLEDRRHLARVQKGIIETLTTGNLHGTPAIILAGRHDALVFPNYHARPYYGLNQLVEREQSRLRYIEVVNAQHFDAMISNFWLDRHTQAVQFVPLHYYLLKALDWIYAFLKQERSDLPPSQVIRPQPRGLNAYSKTDAGTDLLPPINTLPDAQALITVTGKVLNIPR